MNGSLSGVSSQRTGIYIEPVSRIDGNTYSKVLEKSCLRPSDRVKERGYFIRRTEEQDQTISQGLQPSTVEEEHSTVNEQGLPTPSCICSYSLVYIPYSQEEQRPISPSSSSRRFEPATIRIALSGISKGPLNNTSSNLMSG